jgi:D-3-phosphoglycerate dehydrogenase
MAGITEESMLRMGQGVVAEARRVLSGGLPENLVNPGTVPAYRKRFPA